MKYAHIDQDNNLIGWYDSDIHDNIPTPNVQVSEEQWLKAININANKVYIDGSSEQIIQIDKNTEIQKQIFEAKLFLQNTDWYYFRFLDENKPIPKQIVKERIEKRNLINELESKL